MKTLVTINVNGEDFEVPVAPTDFLVDVIKFRSLLGERGAPR